MDNTWFEDQRQAAAADAERLAEHLGAVGPDISGAVVRPLWERHQAVIASHQGRDCGHVNAMPRPLYALACTPGYLMCQPCGEAITFGDLPQTCDLCGNPHPQRGARYRGVIDFVIFIVGLCDDCQSGRPPSVMSGASPWPSRPPLGGNRAARRAAARKATRKRPQSAAGGFSGAVVGVAIPDLSYGQMRGSQ